MRSLGENARYVYIWPIYPIDGNKNIDNKIAAGHVFYRLSDGLLECL